MNFFGIFAFPFSPCGSTWGDNTLFSASHCWWFFSPSFEDSPSAAEPLSDASGAAQFRKVHGPCLVPPPASCLPGIWQDRKLPSVVSAHANYLRKSSTQVLYPVIWQLTGSEFIKIILPSFAPLDMTLWSNVLGLLADIFNVFYDIVTLLSLGKVLYVL